MLKLHSEQGEISRLQRCFFQHYRHGCHQLRVGAEGAWPYRSMTDGLVHLLRREAMSKGVKVDL